MTIQFELSEHLYKCLQKRIELNVASEIDRLVAKGKVVEQEPKTDYKAFAEWVAREVIDEENWEWNSGAFPELACRKLNKLGVVDTDGKNWIYENEALEQEDCEEYKRGWHDAIVTALKETHNYYTEDGVFSAIQEESLIGVGMSMQEPKTDILDRLKEEITNIEISGQVDSHTSFIRTGEQVKDMTIEIIDKYRQKSGVKQ